MLSNKLTFSLTFIVMLAIGLTLTASPAFAGKYTATYNTGSSQWTLNIDFPAAGEVELTTNGLALINARKIAPDSNDTNDGLSGIAVTNVTANNTDVATPAFIQSDGSTAAISVRQTAYIRYVVTLSPTTNDNTATTAVDEGVVTFTVDGYVTVNLSTADRESGHSSTALSTPRVAQANTINFRLDASDSRFHIIYDRAADSNATAERLSNGIRLGTGYVNADATTAADLPDLAAFFSQGGSIKLLDDGNTPAVTSGVFITEVMWGYDAMDGTGAPSSDNQWIEVYYQVGEVDGTAPDAVDLKLQFVYNALDRGGVDEVSNLYLAKWDPKGQSGRSGYSAVDGSAPIPVVSMYRKRDLADGASPVYRTDKKFATDGFRPGSWDASKASLNMDGAFTGTPGSPHLPARVGTHGVVVTPVPESPIRINEVRNDTSADNVDWIELYNVSYTGSLKDIELSVITGVSRHDLYGERGYHKNNPAYEAKEHDKAIVGYDDHNNDGVNDVKRFPDWKLPVGAFLVITNQVPSGPAGTILAGGKDIEILANPNIDDKTTNLGSDVYYFVTSHLNGRLDKRDGNEPMLLLRNKVDKNEKHEAIIDAAGGGRYEDNVDIAKYNFNTEVWPLKGTKKEGGPNFSAGGAWDLTEGDPHQWWKSKGVSSTGLGYDKNVDLRLALGTPGYDNGAVKGKIADLKAGSRVSISEIMFDASVHAGNERWNLVQWIELYNSSMTEAVNIKGWELEIRNSDDHVDSFVDSSFTFNDAIIQPNQTLLLVSARASNDGIADRQIYNLFTQHARVLGLANRRANLLSPAGFFLRLTDNADAIVDEVGNVVVKGRDRTTNKWSFMPPADDDIRTSLIRQYGDRAQDGNGPDDPAVGTMEDGWILADLDGEGSTYYGQRGDIATPGFRTGGPLPVSLSSFRPARDKATGEVVIRWVTQSEVNNAGFNILRSETKNGEFTVVNLKGIIPGHGTTSEKHVYEWKDTTAKPNVVYYYQIEDVSFEGQRTTLATTHLRGNVTAAGKVTTTWGNLKTQN